MTRLLLGALALLLSSGVPAVAETVLNDGIPAEPETLDPALTTGSYDLEIEYDLWEGLTARDAANHRIPGAAASWEISPDRLTYTFHLRPDLVYSNGEPVHAADFVYMIRRTADPKTGTENGLWLVPIVNAPEIASGKLTDLTQIGASAPDDHTVVVRLWRPSYQFLDYSALIFPLRQQDVEANGAEFVRPGKLVANGAFMLDEWVPQSHISLIRNPKYREADRVKLDRINFLFVDDQQTALKMFRETELDIALAPQREYQQLKQEMPAALRDEPMVGTYFIALNLGAPPFKDNLKLRRALAMAVDPAIITDKVIRAAQFPAWSFIPQDLPQDYVAQTEAFKDMPASDRLAEARRLYAEAGYGPQHPLTLHVVYTKGREQERWVPAVCDMWHTALGVIAKPEVQEYRIWLGTLNHHNFTAAVDDWESQPLGDADILEDYSSTQNQNDLQYSNAAYDEALTAADTATDRAGHLAAFQKAERLFIDDQAIVPIFHLNFQHLVSPVVKGWTANDTDMHPARYFEVDRPAPAR